jgi:hypothetical protein
MALVIAACVFIGDLIAALTYFLRGEITSRFLAKACVVLLISGGVFFYYFGGLKKTEESETQGDSGRSIWMASLSSVVVIVMLLLGFVYIGAPGTQRTLRADRKRVQDLYQLTARINGMWNSKDHKLPEHLDELQDVPLADPMTRAAYEYHVTGEGRYELCATFALPSEKNAMPRPGTWSHPAGRHCFSIQASQMLGNPYGYFPD